MNFHETILNWINFWIEFSWYNFELNIELNQFGYRTGLGVVLSAWIICFWPGIWFQKASRWGDPKSDQYWIRNFFERLNFLRSGYVLIQLNTLKRFETEISHSAKSPNQNHFFRLRALVRIFPGLTNYINKGRLDNSLNNIVSRPCMLRGLRCRSKENTYMVRRKYKLKFFFLRHIYCKYYWLPIIFDTDFTGPTKYVYVS